MERLHKMVNGEQVPLTEQEEAELRAEWAANAQRAIKDKIRGQIAILEAQITSRRIREAILSGDNTFIQGIETQIQALRNQL
jgi:hypothetical protein